MTRKRRKTRSRQERRRIHARTRQTLEQAHRRCLEACYRLELMRRHPFLDLEMVSE